MMIEKGLLLALSTFALTLHRSHAQCPATQPTPLPDYPAQDGGFSTNGLVAISDSFENINMKHIENTPPQGWQAQVDCPHHSAGLVHWNDASIWPNNQVPAPGASVTLPANRRVLISSCSLHATPYGTITIPQGSELVFNDQEISLSAQGIDVQGKLTIGAETCRVRASITITLYGSRPNTPQPPIYKGIDVNGAGILNLHGALFHPTWTRLAKTARQGDTVIYLMHRVNWQPGQKLVVTSTELKDSRDWHRNEVRTISSVQVNGAFSAVYLSEPLSFEHHASSNYQAEVGLLSRTILIQGDPSSEPTDTDNDVCSDSMFSSYPCPARHLTGFGGHVMVRGSNAIGRVSGVEFFRMGQTNVLARYPFHFHMMREAGADSYIKDSSVHHSFYRCITVHGTNHTLVRNNVAYDAIGHCFYLEDGIEEENSFEFNLAAHIHFMEYPRTAYAQFMDDVHGHANLIVPADTTASGFYITNPYNRYVGNAASGGYAGFAFVNLPNPIGLHRSVAMAPNESPANRPALEFDSNSCHSSGWWWGQAGCIYVGGLLQYPSETSDTLVYNPGRQVSGRNTRCLRSPGSYQECPLVMTNTKVFLANWGINNWGSRGEFYGIEAHDTQRALGIIGKHYVTNLLTVCRTGFQPSSPGTTWMERRWFHGSYVGFEWYDTWQSHIVTDSTFRNCGDAARGAPIWRSLTHSYRFVPGFMQGTRNIRYENSDLSMIFRPSVSSKVTVSGWLTNWYDADGSAFQTGRPTIVGNARDGFQWWNFDPDCTFIVGDWYVCPQYSQRTGNRRNVGYLYMIHDQSVVDQMEGGSICVNSATLPNPCPIFGKVTHFGKPVEDGIPLSGNPTVTGVTGTLGWYFVLDKGSAVRSVFSMMQIDDQDTLMIVMPFPTTSTFTITYEAAGWCNPRWHTCSHAFSQATSAEQVRQGRGDLYYFDQQRGLLFFRIVQRNPSTINFDNPATGLPYFEHEEIRIPSVMWGGTVVVQADCPRNPQDSNYCQYSHTPESIQDPCAVYGFSGAQLVGTDDCISSETNPTNFPTRSPTKEPTLHPTQAPSRRATSSPSRSPTLDPTQSPISYDQVASYCANFNGNARRCNGAPEYDCRFVRQGRKCLPTMPAPPTMSPTQAPFSPIEFQEELLFCSNQGRGRKCTRAKPRGRCKWDRRERSCVTSMRGPPTSSPTASPITQEFLEDEIDYCNSRRSNRACKRTRPRRRCEWDRQQRVCRTPLTT